MVGERPFRRCGVRILRGRVVVREDKRRSSIIIDPMPGDPREETTHRGVVLAVGAGAPSKGGIDCPLDVKPGDVVQFHFEGTERGRLATWDDGQPAIWLAHREIDGVWA